MRVVREVAGILLDALVGSRCPNCGSRNKDLSEHYRRDRCHW